MSIEVYDLTEKQVLVSPTYERLQLSDELRKLADEKWNPSWKPAWIPCGERMEITPRHAIVDASVSNYKEQRAGLINAIVGKLPFAPKSGGVTGLGVSV